MKIFQKTLILVFEVIVQQSKHTFQITLFTQFQLIVGRRSQCWQFHGKFLKNIVSHMNFENIVINEVLFSGRTIRSMAFNFKFYNITKKFLYFPQKNYTDSFQNLKCTYQIISSFAKFDLYFEVHFRIHLNSWPRIRNYSTFFPGSRESQFLNTRYIYQS